jgi:hypothetical protein
MFEGKSLDNSIWWAVVTGQTVGYGDFYPVTMPGRAVAMFLMITMTLLWIILGAYVTIHLVLDANLFSHEEQESLKNAALLHGIDAGYFPTCLRELPPPNWNALQHNRTCKCGWEVPPKFRRYHEAKMSVNSSS